MKMSEEWTKKKSFLGCITNYTGSTEICDYVSQGFPHTLREVSKTSGPDFHLVSGILFQFFRNYHK